jgi:hypothetical protein
LFSPAFAETPGQQESRQPPTAFLGEICAAKVADIQSILTGLILERLSIYSGQVRGLLAAGVERGQMIKSWTRREVVTSVGVAAIGSSVSLPKLTSAGSSPEQAKEGKRLTLLHFTDTHAQLETHPEYLPGATPEIQMMGGYARGIANHHFQLIPILASRYDEDPEVKDLVEKSLSLHRPRMAKWIGKTETVLMRYDLLETTADNFIADAVREPAKTDIGFTNGFRFGVPVLPQNVTEADLWNLSPMDARMKRGWVTGKELKDYLERELEMVYAKNPLKLNGGWGARASGMSFILQARAEEGRRVVSVKINGIEVEDDVHYTIAGCEREGEPLDVICRHRGSHDARILPVSIQEALAQYFQVHPVVAPTREGREKGIDLPSAVFSQDAVLAGGNLSEAPTTPHGIPPG